MAPDVPEVVGGDGDTEVVEVADPSVTILDEHSQANYDRAAIEQTMNQIRGLMANAKVNMRLAQHGLLESGHDLHPNKFKEAIAQHRQALTVLTELWDEVGELGLPEPSKLDVLTGGGISS